MAVLLTLAVWAAVATAPDEFAWPLDLPRVVTATFGEYRVGRFHAGVDLHTGGIGQPVHAPADACVARVSCSPWGYGKGVYLKLADGHTVVFGHLSAYAPALRDYVRKAQHAAHKYSVDLNPEPAAFPVKRGEVVAFSGDTGVGGAHLHYEFRDADGAAVNPRKLGVVWTDTTPPVIHRLLVVPHGARSRVNGDFLPVVLNVRATRPSQYTCNPVRVSGRFGFGLDVIDPANQGSSRLGVYQLRTVIDGKEIFQIQMNRFAYDHRDNELVSYYPFLMDQGQFLLQWRWPGNVCDIFNQSPGDGWCEAPKAPVEARLEAEDFDGNRAVLTFTLEPDTHPDPAPPKSDGKGRGEAEVAFVGTWVVVSATFTAPEPNPPALSVEGGADQAIEFHRIDDHTFRAAVVPAKEASELVVRVTHPRIEPFEDRLLVFHRGAADRTIDVDGARVTVRSNSPYGTMFLRAFPAETTSKTPVPMRGKALRLGPSSMPVDQPIEIALPHPADAEQPNRCGVYRDAGSYWQQETASGAKDRFQASTRRLATFAVLEDTVPPALSNIVVGKGGDAASKRPTIRATVSDTGSGIADASATCNGQWLLMAYDPDRNIIEWERDEDLPDPPRELTFTITDNAGNTTTSTKTLEPPAPQPKTKAPAPKSHRPKPQPPKPAQPRAKKQPAIAPFIPFSPISGT